MSMRESLLLLWEGGITGGGGGRDWQLGGSRDADVRAPAALSGFH